MLFKLKQLTSFTLAQFIAKVTDVTKFITDKAAEISTFTIKGSPVSTDLVLLEDSEDSYSKKKVQVGSLGGAANKRVRSISGVLSEGQPYLIASGTSYTLVQMFRWAGSTKEGALSGIAAILAITDVTETLSIRVYDITNAAVISEATGLTFSVDDEFELKTLPTPANIPSTPAIWEIQLACSATRTDMYISDLSLEFG